jgi:hypothetical protein
MAGYESAFNMPSMNIKADLIVIALTRFLFSTGKNWKLKVGNIER